MWGRGVSLDAPSVLTAGDQTSLEMEGRGGCKSRRGCANLLLGALTLPALTPMLAIGTERCSCSCDSCLRCSMSGSRLTSKPCLPALEGSVLILEMSF
eukprot:355986-Chlamydomonas_euryale.AAC.11